MKGAIRIDEDNLDTIVALDLREVASDALREGYTLTLHRLRGCDVRPDWSETDGVELLICSAGFVAAAANGGAKWDCSSPMLRKSSEPATIAWWIWRHDAETATIEENAAAREYGEQWARTQFDALVEESSRVLSDHAEICGPWNRHPAGFPECADGVAEKAARAEWARLVEEEAVAVAREALEERGIECKNHEALVDLGERLVHDRSTPMRDDAAMIDAWLNEAS